MHSTIRLLSLIILVFIASNSCTSSTSPQKPRILRIVCFGDSTTAERENIRSVYASRIRDYFSKSHPNLRLDLFNSGVRSDTTRRARTRFKKDVLAHTPHLVIIQFGLNDSCIDVYKGESSPRVSKEEYSSHLSYFIQTLKKRNIKVILMTQNPMIWTDKTVKVWGKPPYNTEDRWGFNLLNTHYAQEVRRLARQFNVPLVDVYRMFLQYDSAAQRHISELMVDGIHPNDRGHRLIARSLIPIIKKLLISN